MRLYESLVRNIGIGKEALNKKYLKSVFGKPTAQQWFTAFCNRYDLVPTIAELKSLYKGVDSQKIDANWRDYDRGEEIAYTLYYKKDDSWFEPIILDSKEEYFAIIDLKELKEYYDKLDKLFKRQSPIDEPLEQMGAWGGKSPDMRYYLWKDCKYSIEELMVDNKLMKELNESLVKNIGIGIESLNRKYINSLMEAIGQDKLYVWKPFLTDFLNATDLNELKDKRFVERSLKKKDAIKGMVDGDLSEGEVYDQKYGHLGGIYGFIRFVGGSSKHFSPVRFYKYGLQVLSLPDVDYSNIDKLFKKKTTIKDNYTLSIQFEYFDYQISDCKVLLQDL